MAVPPAVGVGLVYTLGVGHHDEAPADGHFRMGKVSNHVAAATMATMTIEPTSVVNWRADQETATPSG